MLLSERRHKELFHRSRQAEQGVEIRRYLFQHAELVISTATKDQPVDNVWIDPGNLIRNQRADLFILRGLLLELENYEWVDV